MAEVARIAGEGGYSVNVYIACNLGRRDLAVEVGRALVRAGHRIASSWHDDHRATVASEASLSVAEETAIRERCFREVASADALVLVACPGERHGAHVESGYALGRDIPVVTFLAGGVDSILTRGGPFAVDAADLVDVLATMEERP